MKLHALTIAGLALIALSNLVILGGVADNRSEHDATLQLTERELALPSSHQSSDNNGVRLRLAWRAPPDTSQDIYNIHSLHTPAWLTAEKLNTLGFTPPGNNANRSWASQEREVFLLLEMDGDGYRAIQARLGAQVDAQRAKLSARGSAENNKNETDRLERLQRQLREDSLGVSRLIAIDAHTDRGILRSKYPDTSRYAIARARIYASYTYKDSGQLEIVHARITGLSVPQVNVPLQYRHIFEPLLSSEHKPGASPRYEVTLAFGKRLEPWVVDARRID